MGLNCDSLFETQDLTLDLPLGTFQKEQLSCFIVQQGVPKSSYMSIIYIFRINE